MSVLWSNGLSADLARVKEVLIHSTNLLLQRNTNGVGPHQLHKLHCIADGTGLVRTRIKPNIVGG